MLPDLNMAYQGNAADVMKEWDGELIDCTVTSPPYFQLRSYLPDSHESRSSEIGGGSLLRYIADLKDVFNHVFRLTKPKGTLWLNIGDTWCNPKNKKALPGHRCGEKLNVPHRVSEALREVGWRLISEVIWDKPNANPHSSAHHPIYSHEIVFQFAKSNDHYYDSIPLLEEAKYQVNNGRTLYRHARSVWSIPTVGINGRDLLSDFREDGVYYEFSHDCPRHGYEPNGKPFTFCMDSDYSQPCDCKPVTADFFAVMPELLAKRLIMSSTSEVGNCAECGAPLRRASNVERIATRPGNDNKVDPAGKARRDPGRHVSFKSDSHWAWTCSHDVSAGRRRPLVFDPFAGSGTTLVAADTLFRDFIGIELNPLMVERMIPARLRKARADHERE